MATPKLRFKEFTSEWERKFLKDILIVNSGRDYKHLNFGHIPVYGTGGYMTSVDSSLSKEDAVGIGRKGSIDKPQKLTAPFWCVDTLFYCTSKNGTDLNFLYTLFNKIIWKKYDESTGVPSLSKNTIENITLNIPNKLEQKKIGSFFENIDYKIQLLQEKIELLKKQKKAYMQKIFSLKMRFKDENGKVFADWQTNKLSHYIFEHKIRNLENFYSKEDVLSVSGEHGIVNQIEFQGRSFAGKSVTNYHVVHTGDIVYTKSPLKSNPYGIIKCNKHKTGIVSTLYAVYSCKETIIGEFLDYYFQLDDHTNSYLRPLVNKGAKNDMKINNESVLKGEITAPLIEEQKKIIHFISALDNRIQLQEAKWKNLIQQKKYFMQQMFI